MTKSKITESSGNVFVDLGFDAQEAEELILKANLFHNLQDAIQASQMTQKEVARILGTDQSKVSKILRGRMSEFSVDRIASYLLKLGWDLKIEARPAPQREIRGRVVVAAEKARKRPAARQRRATA